MTPPSRSGDMDLFPPNAVPRSPAAPRMPSVTHAEVTYSVSQINGMVQAALKERFPRQIWVRGEIQGYDLRKHRETVSFTLAEKSEHSDDVQASVTALIFGDDRRAIEALLRQSENAFALQDGIEVRFRVEVDLWAKAGRYQLRVRGIDPTYTLGRLAQNRRKILDRLNQQGLMTRNKERALPLVPLRIGVIGAKGSAGLNDFITHLTQSGFAFAIQFINAAMQGGDVERDVVAAMRYFNQALTIDVIVITRGGGAATDLSWFDRYGLGVAIANSALPVLTGLGHTHDTSVADLVAHADLKTPTDAAQFLVDRVGAFAEYLRDAGQRLGDGARQLLDEEHAGLAQRAGRITDGVREAVHALNLWIADRQRTLIGRTQELVAVEWEFLRGCAQRVTPSRLGQLVSRQQRDLVAGWRRMAAQSAGLVQRGSDELAHRQRACSYARLSRSLTRDRDWLTHVTATVGMLDPSKTLKRGFSILRNAQHQIISKTSQVSLNQAILAQVSDGSIRSRVDAIQPLDGSDAAS